MTTNWYEVQNADQIPSPALLLYPDRIRHNLQTMVAWSGNASSLRPHVKTHKMPDVVRLKLAAGITKFKASTIAEVEMSAEAGARDILLAYQPVGPNVRRLVELAKRFPEAKLATIVDHPATVHALSQAAQLANVTLTVFLDLDVGMHRTGIAPNEEAFELYKSFGTAPHLEAGGIHAYDGHLHQSNYEELCSLADSTFQGVWEFRDQLESQGFVVPTIVAAGTPTSMLLSQSTDSQAKDSQIEVSAGTSVLWDSGYEAICPQYEFQHAAVLLARVISKPQSDLLCLDLGYKAVASESAPPRVRFFGLEHAEPVNHSEEHLVLKTPDAVNYSLGSLLYGIPHHVCPTVALHQEAWIVEAGIATGTWPVTARNRRLTV